MNADFDYRGLAFEALEPDLNGDVAKTDLHDWVQRIDWMADHHLNTLMLFANNNFFPASWLSKYPDLQPFVPSIACAGEEASRLFREIITYCHGKEMKVVLVMGIDCNNQIAERFPELKAVRPDKDPEPIIPGIGTNILCPSRPAIRAIYRALWEELASRFPEADGFGVMPPDSGILPCVCDLCRKVTPAQLFAPQVKEMYDITKAHAPKALFVSWVGYGYMDKYAREYADALPKDAIIEVHLYDNFDYHTIRDKKIELWAATGHPVWFKMALYRFAWIETGKPAPVRVIGADKIRTVADAARDGGAVGMFGFCADQWHVAEQNLKDFVNSLQDR